jgi:hypothetical protein
LDFILEAHKLDDEYEGQETKKKKKQDYGMHDEDH